MVRVCITDTTIVGVPGGSISGPVSFDGDSVTIGMHTYHSGAVVVQAGTGVQVMNLHPLYMQNLPLGLVAVFIFGLYWAYFTRR